MRNVLAVLSVLAIGLTASTMWLAVHDFQGLLVKVAAVTASVVLGIQNIIAWFLLIRQRQEKRVFDDTSRTHLVTGLPNRRCVVEQLSAALKNAMRQNTPYGILIVGLDDFGAVNERFAEIGGNVVLRQVGEAIRSQCRDSDLIGHYEGDQFLVGAPNANAEGSLLMARRLHRDLTSRTYQAKGGSTMIRTCVGIAVAPPCEYVKERIIQSALDALKTAKRMGKNRIFIEGDVIRSDHKN